MDVVGREGWRRRIGDKRLIRVWSEAVCIIKQYDQQQCTVYHQTMALIGFAALLKWDDRHKIFTRRLSPGGTGWKDVFGGTRHSLLQNRAQTPAHHSKSMLINNVMNNWKDCFDVVHTKERKEGRGVNKQKKCISQLLTMTSTQRGKYSSSVSVRGLGEDI